MIRRLREVIGLPVLAPPAKEPVGVVKDVLLDEGEAVVIGLVLGKESLLGKEEVLARQDVENIGAEKVLLRLYRKSSLGGLCRSARIGTKVFDRSGESMGTISDIYTDEHVSQIVGYEISDGFFGDVWNGRDAILRSRILAYRGECLVVDKGAKA